MKAGVARTGDKRPNSCQFLAYQAELINVEQQQKVRKTYKYKLMPTPARERVLEHVLWRCHTLYNTALEERKTAWERCRVSVSYYQQKAKLPDLKAACPEYGELHSHVLQDVLL